MFSIRVVDSRVVDSIDGSSESKLLLKTLFIVSAAFLYFWHVQTLSPSMPDRDPYYHIKVASLMRESGVIYQFPWTRFGLWKDEYFDKDFLFHVALLPFAGDDLFAGAKLASAVFAAIAVGVFYLCLARHGVRYPLIFTLLLFAAGYGWLSRMVVLRGYLFSLCFVILGLLAIFKNCPRKLFFLSLLYALTYNSAFLLPCFSIVYFIARRFRDQDGGGVLVTSSFLGVIFGTLLHPHRRYALENLILQNFSVPLEAWFGGSSIRMAAELESYGVSKLIVENPLSTSLFAITLIMVCRFRKLLNADQITLASLTFVFFFATLFSQRFVEYWVPMQVWSSAALLPLFARSRFAATKARRISLLIPCFLGLCLALVRDYRFVDGFFRYVSRPASYEAAQVLLKQNPPEANVFTCDWDDAAHLFFYNAKARYMLMADPLYMQRPYPELWIKWRAAVEGEDPNLYRTISETFNSNYVYCTKDFRRFIDLARKDARFVLRHETAADVLFEIMKN